MGSVRMSPLGLHGSASSDAIHNLLFQQQQSAASAASATSVSGGFGSSASVAAKPLQPEPFNAIQSLLSQLQQEGIMPMAAVPSANVEMGHRRGADEKTQASIWDLPSQQDQKV
jgi:hypothetical protein